MQRYADLFEIDNSQTDTNSLFALIRSPIEQSQLFVSYIIIVALS